jgi:protein involved in polysaccharide export with SLBB domain
MLFFYTLSLGAQESQGTQSLWGAQTPWGTQSQTTQNKNTQTTPGLNSQTDPNKSTQAEDPNKNTELDDLNKNAQLARSNPDYLVTAGDVYTLAYLANNTPVTYMITVDSSYRIRMSNLGIINAAGKTFRQLKIDAETIVSNNFPLSGVQLVLTQPGIFRVFVNGEVQTATEISTWALARLSSLTRYMTPYASMRDVTIQSRNGQVKHYDLFKAERLGDLKENPYLRPDDTITFNRLERQVAIDGWVERPGVYQLLAGEHLKDLIETYGNGLTHLADPSRIEIVRYVNSNSPSGDKIAVGEVELAENYLLENYDMIYVPSIETLRPVFFIEGAIKNTNEIITEGPSSSFREVVSFNKGETYSSVVRRNIRWFTEESDTANAYIERGTERMAINLNRILYDATFRNEIFIEENDSLIIPFRQYFITVAGAVLSPGRYPYIPDRNWEYYVSLAGGFVAERNISSKIRIVDFNGKPLKKTDLITPETTITASTNHWLYYVNQFAPLVTTILSIITTTISLSILTRQL